MEGRGWEWGVKIRIDVLLLPEKKIEDKTFHWILNERARRHSWLPVALNIATFRWLRNTQGKRGSGRRGGAQMRAWVPGVPCFIHLSARWIKIRDNVSNLTIYHFWVAGKSGGRRRRTTGKKKLDSGFNFRYFFLDAASDQLINPGGAQIFFETNIQINQQMIISPK